MNVLVVAAHPDDEALGCGGTIARLAREGHEVTLAILGEGATARSGAREKSPRSSVEALQTASRESARALGAREVEFAGLPDNRLDTLPLLDVVKTVERWVERFRPEVVYTHHSGDLNVDHQIARRALVTATRPQPGQVVREIYAFEVPSVTEWSFGATGPSFRPNYFVDISDTLRAKLASLDCYRTELRPFPHPRSPEAVEAAARRWGSVAGFAAAEAFEVVRILRRKEAR